MNLIAYSPSERYAPRRAVHVPCQVVTVEDFELLAEQTLDLSLEGMRVQTDKYAPLGEKLVVSFKAPQSTMWFDAEAEVVRNIYGHRRGDTCRAIGLRFSYLDRVSKRLLQSRLNGFPPPVPQRRLRRDYASSVYRVFYSQSADSAMA